MIDPFFIPAEILKSLASRSLVDDVLKKVHGLKLIAAELCVPLPQLVLAWCASNPNVSTVITGATKESQVNFLWDCPCLANMHTYTHTHTHRYICVCVCVYRNFYTCSVCTRVIHLKHKGTCTICVDIRSTK